MDEETSVKVTALEALANIVPYVTPDTVKNEVVALAKKMCEQSLSSGEESVVGMARLLGRLSYQLRGTCIHVHVWHLSDIVYCSYMYIYASEAAHFSLEKRVVSGVIGFVVVSLIMCLCTYIPLFIILQVQVH